MKHLNTASNSHVPLISVITVSLNSADYLEQCIKSVLTQDCNDFEYVIIDGGSTDATVKIIQKYQDRLAYWHSKPDRGLAHAFNLGVEHSKGHWLLFLNSDDYFAETAALTRLADGIEKYPNADVVFGQVLVVSREFSPKRIGGPYGGPFRWSDFVMRDTIPHQGALTSRRFLERMGPFSENFRIMVDYEHLMRAGPALKACFVPVLVSCMRDDGLSRSNVPGSLREWREAATVHDLLPGLLAWVFYYYFLARSFVGRHARRILGPSCFP
jgi:glycosyltransferase involved in cell wall biosynthesis